MRLEGLSLFFPCHNEEANIGRVLADALRAASLVADRFEIIVVDDGSRDGTDEAVRRVMAESPEVRLVRHAVNRGYGEALRSGFRAARFPWVFYSDGDGQFDLQELPRLAASARNADIVSGVRLRRADPWHRKLNAFIFQCALRLFMGLRVKDVDCAFKLYRREVFDEMTLRASGAMIDAEVLSKARRNGRRIVSVGVSHRPRIAGVSSGGNPWVILKAMGEFWKLWWDLRRMPRRAARSAPLSPAANKPVAEEALR